MCSRAPATESCTQRSAAEAVRSLRRRAELPQLRAARRKRPPDAGSVALRTRLVPTKHYGARRRNRRPAGEGQVDQPKSFKARGITVSDKTWMSPEELAQCS